jgi:hypothetical protein
MSFKVDENGVLIDAEKTFTLAELYESLKPVEYQVEEEVEEEVTNTNGQFQ